MEKRLSGPNKGLLCFTNICFTPLTKESAFSTVEMGGWWKRNLKRVVSEKTLVPHHQLLSRRAIEEKWRLQTMSQRSSLYGFLDQQVMSKVIFDCSQFTFGSELCRHNQAVPYDVNTRKFLSVFQVRKYFVWYRYTYPDHWITDTNPTVNFKMPKIEFFFSLYCFVYYLYRYLMQVHLGKKTKYQLKKEQNVATILLYQKPRIITNYDPDYPILS